MVFELVAHRSRVAFNYVLIFRNLEQNSRIIAARHARVHLSEDLHSQRVDEITSFGSNQINTAMDPCFERDLQERHQSYVRATVHVGFVGFGFTNTQRSRVAVNTRIQRTSSDLVDDMHVRKGIGQSKTG